LEVRRCRDGHPPVTEREREIRLNGTGGVKFPKSPDRISIRVFSLNRQSVEELQRNPMRVRFIASSLYRFNVI
jgi:hypothetical protein